MITITQPQIDAICWAAERHVRSLKRSGSDHEQEIKEIRGWIEALKSKKCQLSFVRLGNLLKMYPIKQLEINFKLGCDHTHIELMIQLVAQQTETLNRMILDVSFAHDFRGLDKLVNWLRTFDRIEAFTLKYHRVSTEALELIASLPIISFCVRNDYAQSSLTGFIRTNKKIEHLEIVSSSRYLLKALKENRTLQVGPSSRLEAN